MANIHKPFAHNVNTYLSNFATATKETLSKSYHASRFRSAKAESPILVQPHNTSLLSKVKTAYHKFEIEQALCNGNMAIENRSLVFALKSYGKALSVSQKLPGMADSSKHKLIEAIANSAINLVDEMLKRDRISAAAEAMEKAFKALDSEIKGNENSEPEKAAKGAKNDLREHVNNWFKDHNSCDMHKVSFEYHLAKHSSKEEYADMAHHYAQVLHTNNKSYEAVLVLKELLAFHKRSNSGEEEINKTQDLLNDMRDRSVEAS